MNEIRFDPVVNVVQEGAGSVFFMLNGTTTFPIQQQVQIRLRSIDGGSATGKLSFYG